MFSFRDSLLINNSHSLMTFAWSFPVCCVLRQTVLGSHFHRCDCGSVWLSLCVMPVTDWQLVQGVPGM